MRKMTITTNFTRSIVDAGSKIRKMFELKGLALQMGKIPLDFSLGNPGIGPLEEYYSALRAIIDECEEQIKMGKNPHAYMTNSGYLKTKEEVASYMSKEYGIPFQAKHIFMTFGAANAMDILMRTLIDVPDYSEFEKELDGLIKRIENPKFKEKIPKSIDTFARDLKRFKKNLSLENEVICIAPYFVEYDFYIKNNNGKKIVVDSDENFDLDLNKISNAITKRTRAILINSPNNPTGVVYSKEKLKDLAGLLKEKNKKFKKIISVVEDAVYSKLVWNGNEFNSILPYYKNTFFVTSFSKSLGLAAERIGDFAVHPKIGKDSADRETLLDALPTILRTKGVNAPGLQQKAIEKIGYGATSNLTPYKKKIDLLLGVLKENNIQYKEPEGTFYIWAKIPENFENADDFKNYCIRGQNPVFITPGQAFGGEKSSQYARFSVSDATEKEIKAVGVRLKEIVGQKSKDMKKRKKHN